MSFVVGKIKENFLAELIFDIECEGRLGFQEASVSGKK